MCRLAMSDEEKNKKIFKNFHLQFLYRVGILRKKGIKRRKAKLIQ
jgi:hypothetical protein